MIWGLFQLLIHRVVWSLKHRNPRTTNHYDQDTYWVADHSNCCCCTKERKVPA